MGLTSSGGVTVSCKLQARASSRPLLSQPHDYDSKQARAAAMLLVRVTPNEVVTDAAPVYPGVLDELIPQAWHCVEQPDPTPSTELAIYADAVR
ncbi:hypothetical protein [Micromonospora sp. NPDC005173]|uniref:hypothetical protein n=1 Tax=Micromonospora sp. NPDC005173 TaxID=3157165 RepID=UPI0033B4046F